MDTGCGTNNQRSMMNHSKGFVLHDKSPEIEVDKRRYEMLYGEFIEGTGCRDNDHNYKVYKDLEIMYMNSDMSKAEIYEYGKKLVNNSKSEETLKFEAEIKAEIESLKYQIEQLKMDVAYYEESRKMWLDEGDKEMASMAKSSRDFYKEDIKRARNKIKELKWVLA